MAGMLPATETEARAALEALPGLTWRPMARDDLPAVARFFAECETHDDNPERQSLSGLEEYWDSPRSRPEEDTLVGYDATARIVAVAWAGCNRVVTEARGVHLGGGVRPDRRGDGIGRAVLAWEIAHALEWDEATRTGDHGPLVMRLYAPTGQSDVRDLANRHGLPTERYFIELSRSLAAIPVTAPPDGVRIVGWDPARSREVHHVIDDAFHDHWGHTDRTDEM